MQVPELQRWARLDPLVASTDIARWLVEERGCRYAISDLPQPRGERAGSLLTFLFGPEEQRIGHCQYFASATTLLLRASGHHARCVVGFASDEVTNDDVLGGQVIFRALDAHAWVEVLSQRNGQDWWHRVDPTPGAYRSMRRSGVDALNAPAPELDVLEGAELPREDVSEQQQELQPLWLWIVEGAVAMCAIAAAVWLRYRGQRDPQTARKRVLQRQTDDLIAIAIDLGVSVDHSTTLTRLAETIQTKTGIDLSEHLQSHLRARYGDGPVPDAWPLPELRQAARNHRRESRRLHSVVSVAVSDDDRRPAT